MPESDAAVIGRHACGCITYANAAPDRMTRDDERELARYVREGGEIIRTTVAEARAMPHFLVGECPHEPKGWEPDPPPPEATSRCSSTTGRRDVFHVTTKTKHSTGWPSGFVRKYERQWWATEGWFDREGPGAHGGRDAATEGGPSEVFGPFASKREAVAHLTTLAIGRSREFSERIAAERTARAASTLRAPERDA